MMGQGVLRRGGRGSWCAGRRRGGGGRAVGEVGKGDRMFERFS